VASSIASLSLNSFENDKGCHQIKHNGSSIEARNQMINIMALAAKSVQRLF